MKRIGIITFQFAHNFGAVLQCWALQEVLKDIGDSVSVINYCPNYHMKQYRVFPLDNFFKKGLKGKIKTIASSVVHFKERIIRKKKFESFSKLLNLTERFSDNGLLPDIISNSYDYIVCGSDQIWNYHLTDGTLDSVYFGYTGACLAKRIGYGISVGDAELFQYTNELKEYTREMICISARERKTAEMLESILDRDITCVPDPTLLLDKKEYEKIANRPKYKHYILVYLLDYNQLVHTVISRIQNDENYLIIDISPSKFIEIKGAKHINNIGPYEFLGFIHDAEYVITNSFHGTVFSILFNKAFFCLAHKKRGDRIVNLLNIFNLSQRLVLSEEQMEKIINHKINYQDINIKIEEMKRQGIQYLEGLIE